MNEELKKLENKDDLTQTEMAQERTGLAFERTDLAHERTTLTNSQTLLAYIRTFIAVLAAGIGMFEFVDNSTIVTLGIVMMSVSPIFLIVGIVQFFRVKKRISK